MSEFSGNLNLRATAREDGRTVLSAQTFRAPFHVSKPYWDVEAKTLLIQVVNPTAGILAGDKLESEIAVEANASLLVTTPSASRVFRMKDGVAESRQRLAVAAGAWLEVMPEPLVPHGGSRFRQVTSVEVDGGGALFFVDQLMPGRVAHGEAWTWDRLCLELDVKLNGELILRERLDQSGADLSALAELSGSGLGACFANAILICASEADSPAWRGPIEALHGEGLWVGVSPLRKNGWSFKLVGQDNLRLRSALRTMRNILAEYFPRMTCDPRKL
jgi:urease accessory protein